MKLKFNFLIFTWVLITILLGVACEELPCEYSNGVNVNAGFYESTGVVISETSITSFSLQLLTAIDSSYFENYTTSTQEISFPLSMTEDSSTIVLTYSDLVKDTIIFKYQRTLALQSHPCGFDTFFEIKEIINTNNRLDSIWIKKDLVEYGIEENIKIYF